MAGNIQGLSLQLLYNELVQYSQQLTRVQKNLNNIRSGIEALKLHWTGKRMNAIIDKYNEANKTITTAYEFFNRTAKGALDEIHAQYYSMENEGVATDYTYQKTWGEIEVSFSAVEPTSTENVKFEQDQAVSQTNQTIEELNSLITNVTSLVGILDELSSCSDSLNKLVTGYNAQAETFASSIREVEEALKAEVNDALKVVQTTESYNEADANRIQASEN